MTVTTDLDAGYVTVSVPPALAAKLAEPGVGESLAALLSHADLAAVLMTGLDNLISRSEIIGSALLEGLGDLRNAAGEGDAAVLIADTKAFLGVIRSVAGSSPQLLRMLEPDVTEQLAMVGFAVEEGHADFERNPIPIDGLRSVMKLLKDPEITRAISYFVMIAKAIGRHLGK